MEQLATLMAMQAASTLTAAVVSNLEDNLTVDIDIRDEQLRAENLMTWELFRIFYHAVVNATEDKESWPAPDVSLTKLIPGLDLEALVKAASDTGITASALGEKS